MTFKFVPNPIFKADVLIPTPGGDPQTLKVNFKHKGRKALAAFYESLTVEGQPRDDVDALCDLIDGWDKGETVEFSRDNLADLIDNYPGATMAFFESYRKNLIEGRTKNS